MENNQHYMRYTDRMIMMYFILTFAITWFILIPVLWFIPEDMQIIFICLAAFGPFLAAVITIWKEKEKDELIKWLRQIFTLRIPISLYLLSAFIIPIGIGMLHYFLYITLGGKADLANAVPWQLYLLYLIPTALLSGGNEEPGWRGFALPALLERFHPLVASLILGFIHALWHLPLMGHYDTSFGWYLFDLIPLTVLFNWLYLVSRKSVIPLMLFHAGVNVVSVFLPTPNDVLDGIGTYMFLRGTIYWVLAIGIVIFTKGKLGYPKNQIGSTFDTVCGKSITSVADNDNLIK